MSNKMNVGKSFKISGSHIEHTNYFKENFLSMDDFNNNFDVEDTVQTEKGPSNWKIIEFEKEDGRMVLTNESEITDKSPKPEFASMLVKKDFDTQNGMLRLNIYYDSLASSARGKAGACAIYFRYYDKANFYVLKMNVPERDSMELYKMVGGEEHLIGGRSDKVKFGVWYRFTIVFYMNHIMVYR